MTSAISLHSKVLKARLVVLHFVVIWETNKTYTQGKDK